MIRIIENEGEIIERRIEKIAIRRPYTPNSLLSVHTTSCRFRKKDYNRIGHRLRNYQSLMLFMQSPTLSDMRDIEKINTNMRDLDVNIKEIGLAIDGTLVCYVEMVEDWEWLGLSVFAEVLTSLMDMLRTQYEDISRKAK